MSKRSKRSTGNNLPESQSNISIPLSALMGSFGGGVGGGGYQGAQWSPSRGYIYWPTLDPKFEMDAYSRRELARRIHFLKANVGLPKRILTGLTNLIVGAGLWPKALTGHREWNQAADKYYYARAKSPISFDVTEKFAAGEFQRQAVETRLGDGDAAIIYSFSQSGRLLRKLYSGLQIGNSNDPGLDQSRWVDGVFQDSLERSALYRFLNSNGSRSRDVEARNMVFLAKYPKPGAVHGESILAHAVNKLIDVTEITSAWVQNIKNSSSIGYYLSAGSPITGSQGMPAEVMKRMYSGQSQQVDVGGGKKINLKLVYGNGSELVELPPGYDIKTLLDERPHPNQAEHLDEMIRDITWGTGLSFDLLWKIYKLGGANTRYMLADAQVYAETEQDRLVYSWLMRDYVQTIARGMLLGDLPPCPDPEWWNHGWIPPGRMTVDFGRDGRIYMEEYSRGLITTERYFSLKGQDAKEEFITECDYAEFRRDEMKRRGLTDADFAYQTRLPIQLSNSPESEEQEEDEEGDDDDKKKKTSTKDEEGEDEK